MPIVDLALPHFLAGVSQQPPAGRQVGQVEACDNALLHVVNGVAKRPGTRHLAKLIDGDESVRLVHWVNRDVLERYLVLVGERRVRVFEADTGNEFAVKVNGTSTNAGRGKAGSGTPLTYLEPRVQRGIVDQDEDFVIGAGDWLTVAGNVVTSYVSGRGPFKFGRRQSTSSVTADTVAEVGNDAAATIGDIYQDFGTFSDTNAFSVFVKKSTSAINDIELALIHSGTNIYGWRFDIDSNGVVTSGGAQVSGTTPGGLLAVVEPYDDGWYRATIQVSQNNGDQVAAFVGSTRRIRIRFHTNAATPANKRALLFGARCYDYIPDYVTTILPGPITNIQQQVQPVPDYVFERPDLFRALTIADSTLLLNTEQIVGATTGTSPGAPPGGGLRAGVFVKQATASTIYTLTLRATDATTVTYSFTTAAGGTDDTVDIVTGLVAAINGGGGLYTAANNIGSTFLIFNGSKSLGSIAASTGQGDTPMIAFMLNGGRVTRFSDLPIQFASEAGVVKIVGQDSSPTNDFYARFRFHNAFADNDGFWEETLAPGIAFTLAATTLPYTLSRRQDDAAGTITGVPNSIYFDVSVTAWDNRLVGDTTSNPDPGFVGATINDLFLYRGRLGFLSQDKVIMSEAAEILNFWRTTVRELPDTDPIELSHATSYDELLNAAPGGDQLIISSQRRQFQLIGEPVLSPATAQLTPLRGFELLSAARPVDTGRGTIFARQDGGNAGLTETTITQDDLLARFEELSAQAPHYIVGDAVELAHSSITHLTVVRADDPAILYLHQTFFDDQENRVQSAIHRWLFDADTLIRGVCFFEENLKQVVEREEGWFLEEQPTGTELVESTGFFITHLDRRLAPTQLELEYDGGPDETTITLPFDIPASADMRVVDAESGLIVPIIDQPSATELVVSGDLTESSLYVGETFSMELAPTRPVVQEAAPRGGLVPRLSHPTDVRRLHLYLAGTAFLRVETEIDLRTPSSEEFSAAGLGTGLLGMGELAVFTGRADFGVYAEAAELSLTLVNDTPFPSRIQAGRWEVLNRTRGALA